VDAETAEVKALDAAEALFYRRGVQTVGMDEVRSASGVSLKRLYSLFPSKGDLVEAYLRRRDGRWRRRLAEYADARTSPEERILAVFDWLFLWFSEPDFRGCAFINSFGELGATSQAVADIARLHKDEFRRYLAGLVAAANRPTRLTDHLVLLAEGAMTTAAISGSAEPARQAREAAQLLLQVHLGGAPAAGPGAAVEAVGGTAG
jgi:AcrR family transcriptional regulator